MRMVRIIIISARVETTALAWSYHMSEEPQFETTRLIRAGSRKCQECSILSIQSLDADGPGGMT